MQIETCAYGEMRAREAIMLPVQCRKTKLSFMSEDCSHIFEVSFSSFVVHIFTFFVFCLSLSGTGY